MRIKYGSNIFCQFPISHFTSPWKHVIIAIIHHFSQNVYFYQFFSTANWLHGKYYGVRKKCFIVAIRFETCVNSFYSLSSVMLQIAIKYTLKFPFSLIPFANIAKYTYFNTHTPPFRKMPRHTRVKLVDIIVIMIIINNTCSSFGSLLLCLAMTIQ